MIRKMRFSEFSGRPNVNAQHAGPVAVTDTAVKLTTLFTLDDRTELVLIKVETAPIRICLNPTAPDATKGFLYAIDSEIILSRAGVESARVIRSGGTNAALQIAQFNS